MISKNKIFCFGILFFMIFTLFSGIFLNVNAEITGYTLVTWEGFDIGDTSGSNEYITFNETLGTFKVDEQDSDYSCVKSPPKGLKVTTTWIASDTYAGEGNITLNNNYNTINKTTLYFSLDDSSADTSDYLLFDFLNQDGNRVFAFKLYGGYGGDDSTMKYWKSTTDTWQTLMSTDYGYLRKYYMQIQKLSNGNYNFTFYNYDSDTYAYGETDYSTDNQYTNWSRLHIYDYDGDGGGGSDRKRLFLDDIDIVLSDYVAPTYDCFGSYVNETSTYTSSQVVEEKRFLDTTGTLDYFRLYVENNSNYADWDNNKDKFNLTINGELMGSCDGVYTVDENAYQLQWSDLNFTLDSNQPLFELKSTYDFGGGVYWKGIYTSDTDLDNDSDVIYKWDGNINNNYDGITSNRDLSYEACYYTEINVTEPTYESFGTISVDNPFYTSSPYIEEKRFVALSCDVKRLNLYLDTSGVGFTEYENNLGSFTASINGNDLGSANDIIPVYPENNIYALRWYNDGVSISNEQVLMEFKSTHDFGGSKWYGVLADNSDLDLDGDILYKWDGAMNNEYDEIASSKDLSYKLFYENLEYTTFGDYDDFLDSDKNTYEQYIDTVKLIYTLDSMSYQNRLIVENSTTEFMNVTLSSYSGMKSFTPTQADSYTAKIVRNDETKASCSFTVNALEGEHYIYTTPNPVEPMSEFDVYFKYNYTEYPCRIYLRNSETPSEYLQYWDYPENTSDSFSTTINNEGVYYFDLCMNNNGSYSVILRKQHIVKNQYMNSLSASKDVVNIDNNEYQTLSGNHNYLGNNVVVRINDEYEKYVGNQSIFSFNYYPDYSGMYKAELILKTSDYEIELDNVTWSVSGDTEEAPSTQYEDEWEAFSDYIGWDVTLLKMFIGSLIVGGFLVMPLFISKKINESLISNIEIPFIVYIVFGLMGIVLVTGFGLYPFYAGFMITVAIIGIMFIKILRLTGRL